MYSIHTRYSAVHAIAYPYPTYWSLKGISLWSVLKKRNKKNHSISTCVDFQSKAKNKKKQTKKNVLRTCLCVCLFTSQIAYAHGCELNWCSMQFHCSAGIFFSFISTLIEQYFIRRCAHDSRSVEEVNSRRIVLLITIHRKQIVPFDKNVADKMQDKMFH